MAIDFDTKANFLKAFALDDSSFYKELRAASAKDPQNLNHAEYKEKWAKFKKNKPKNQDPFSLIDYDAMKNQLFFLSSEPVNDINIKRSANFHIEDDSLINTHKNHIAEGNLFQPVAKPPTLNNMTENKINVTNTSMRLLSKY